MEKRTFCICDSLKALQMRRLPWILWVDLRQSQGSLKEDGRRDRVGQGDVMMAVGGEVMWGYEPRKVGTSRSWKRQGDGSSRVSRRNAALHFV